MRIAYLNPWENAAENQCYFSLAAAAQKLGHDLIDCRTAEAAEISGAEFVISVASSIPKAVDLPTYLTVHEPRRRFLENAFYMTNLLTYDGYLTISDSLDRFVRDVAFGTGRPPRTGFYYNTPQILAMKADLPLLVRNDKLRIVYLGTNWDNRLPALFRELDGAGVLRIHGPLSSWESETYESYAGPLPFDGIAPQVAYSANGIGLVLLSSEHLRDDVISNRIFEISSAGALSICPAIPWIRKWFADSVLYFDPDAPPSAIAQQIIAHYQFCKRCPVQAQQMAERARSIFERHFAAERLISNAVQYHREVQSMRRERLSSLGEPPTISVIIRCGGRPLKVVREAVDSVSRQTFGRFALIFSKYRPIELSSVTAVVGGNVSSAVEVLTDGGSRAATLATGLREVRTEYFAVLDDDDFWLSDHVESLFVAAQLAGSPFDVVFSGAVCLSAEGRRIERDLVWNRNVYVFGFRSALRSVADITREFCSNSFVARSELLVEGMLDAPGMESAEDSLLVAMVTRRVRPVFSYKATAFFRRGNAGESDFNGLGSRSRDLMTVDLRAGTVLAPHWLNEGSMQSLLAASEKLQVVPAEGAPDVPDPLARPVLSPELRRGWALLEKLALGAGAQRLADGTVSVAPGDDGYALYGPYVDLPNGRYRVEARVRVRSLRWRFGAGRRRPALGALNVVCLATGWEGGTEHFGAGDRAVCIEFELPCSRKARQVEIRVLRQGRLGFDVNSVVLWRADKAEAGQRPCAPPSQPVEASADGAALPGVDMHAHPARAGAEVDPPVDEAPRPTGEAQPLRGSGCERFTEPCRRVGALVRSIAVRVRGRRRGPPAGG